MGKKVKVAVNPQWITVDFVACKGKATATVELSLNLSTGKYDLRTANQEMVSFRNDSLDVVECKISALQTALKYLKSECPKQNL